MEGILKERTSQQQSQACGMCGSPISQKELILQLSKENATLWSQITKLQAQLAEMESQITELKARVWEG